MTIREYGALAGALALMAAPRRPNTIVLGSMRSDPWIDAPITLPESDIRALAAAQAKRERRAAKARALASKKEGGR